MSSPFVYAKVYESVHAPSEYISAPLKCVVHTPLDCKQGLQKDVIQEENDSIINDLPITKDSYIHPSPNQVGIYQQFTHDNTRV